MLHTLISATRAPALCASLLIGFVFTGIGRGAQNPTCTVQVTAGHSIQAAINDAPAGATVCVGPGTYWENLVISKDGTTLRGAGPGKTILKPPKSPAGCEKIEVEPIDYLNFGTNGICIADLNEEGEINRVVNDVRVTGFTVQDFPGVGILFASTNRPHADHNVAANNGSYGITAFASTHGRFDYNTSFGSADAGFYVGNSPNADFRVQYNTAFADLWGILVRDASTGSITDNILHDSCSGLVFLNSGTTTGVHNWQASHNIAVHNNNFCGTEDTGLPFSLGGLGILIAGGDHIVLQENRVRENKPSGEPTLINDVPLAGGIVVVSTANVSIFHGFYGSVASHNLIFNNLVLRNQPFDLAYDGEGRGNLFVANVCGTSSPARLCR